MLKDYYKREIIKIEDDNDYQMFLDYISRHPIFVVKPIDLSNGLGIRKVDSNDYSDKKQLYMETKGFLLIGQVNEYGIFKYCE